MTDFNAIINGNSAATISSPPAAPIGDKQNVGMAGMSGMKISAPANESFLNKAVAHLNRETQRGEHAPNNLK